MTGNLIAYCAQVAILVAAAGAVLALLRPRLPRVRMHFLQAVLGAALALPLLQEWKPSPLPPAAAVRGPVITVKRGAPAPVAPAPFDWNRAAIAVLTIGVVARAAWLALGWARLRRLRDRSEPLAPEPDSVIRARRLIEARAEIRLSGELATPATFGFLRPVVLLPAKFGELAESTQTAVVAHELLHVRRRDWLWTLAEEAAAVVLWFHPAVAWLVSRIRLAREQHVDEVVAEATGSRDAYVDALLTMATANHAAWSPAPLFLRRRTLSERIHNLIEESPMSHVRSLVSYAGAALIAVGAAGFAISQFPLNAAPQAAVGTGPVSIDPGGEVEARMPVRYPMAALKQRVEGTLTIEATLAEDGSVADARVLAGPEELRKAALQSVLQWRYKKGSPRQVTVTIVFRAPERIPEAPAHQVLRKVDVSRLSTEKAEAFQARLQPLTGKPMAEVRAAVMEAMRDIDPAVGVQWQIDPVTGDNMITLLAPGQAPAGTMSNQFPAPAEGVKRLRIGGNVQSSKLLVQVPPQYPPLAKQARIQGTVRFEVLINRDGTVQSLAVANGHPLLIAAAQEAVSQWIWQTTLLNGNPVEVLTVVDVNFTLAP